MTTEKNNYEQKRCEALLAELVHAIGSRTKGTGDFGTIIDGLSLYRREEPSAPASCIIPPSIVLNVQGTKRMWLGGEPYPYGVSRFLVTSLELPGDSEVLEASAKEPCLGLVLKLDLRIMAELLAQGCLPTRRDRSKGMSAGIGSATTGILAPLARLMELLDEPDAIPVMAPLIQREVHYRLLLSDQAVKLRQIAAVDSQGHRIARAIDWLKVNYCAPLRVEELAARVQMSPPTFHQHFRQLTAMSPLQYQKWLRLSEAKRLMLNEHLDVSSAAFKVGYESPSQFSREYSRQFGAAPKRDITLLRSQAQ
ncbi:AraC family transcriptional regulator [Pectobacterium quasiaquaticum]|uniref:AraC family transcriptional regulator n=1 Tax=Pectobacterium quasiaquaticum TaxID=2774015 RepID=UPI0018741D05|nr:AraC family transcriptional regulator [Pectobacterium quasiaquaticum]URG54047.1 AraC family transcriptional regulator [Pectobacterium quasiaquaticum]